MGLIEAVYLSDDNDSLIYEHLLNPRLPPYAAIILKQAQRQRLGAEDNPSIVSLDTNLSLFTHTCGLLRFSVMCNGHGQAFNPAVPFAFIALMVEVFQDYFGAPLTATRLLSNNETLTLLLGEMVEDGYPFVTSANKLREVVPYQNFLTGLLAQTASLSALANKLLAGGGTRKPVVTEPVPWRRLNVKHTKNEIFVDLVETLNVVLAPRKRRSPSEVRGSAFYSASRTSTLVPTLTSIEGKVNLTCHLTGVPTVHLNLNLNHLDLPAPAFHQCINVDRWAQSPGSLSFIPPDGKATIMNYSLHLDELPALRATRARYTGVVDVEYQTELGLDKNEFEIRLISKVSGGNGSASGQQVEALRVEVNCEAISHRLTTIKGIRVTHGDFQYKGEGRAEWVFHHPVSLGSIPLLRARIVGVGEPSSSFRPEAPTPMVPGFLRLGYSTTGALPSGIKVESLRVHSSGAEGIKPYKGVKYIAQTGDFYIRG